MKNDPRTGIVRVKLNHVNKGTRRVLDDTIRVFRDAVSFLTHAASDHASEVVLLSKFDETTFMDHLVHQTKNNPAPEYPEFDALFSRLPSYIRRAANHAACGQVKSYESNCGNYYAWRDDLVTRGHHVKRMEPGFSYTPNACPTLYSHESFDLDGNYVQIKARKNNTWQWITLAASCQDMKCLRKPNRLAK